MITRGNIKTPSIKAPYWLFQLDTTGAWLDLGKFRTLEDAQIGRDSFTAENMAYVIGRAIACSQTSGAKS